MARPQKGGISKLEMIREAVAKLGKEAPLADLLKSIKQTHGINLDRALAYKYKSLVSSKPATGKRRGRKPEAEKGRVGPGITPRATHRSVRARLTHTARQVAGWPTRRHTEWMATGGGSG